MAEGSPLFRLLFCTLHVLLCFCKVGSLHDITATPNVDQACMTVLECRYHHYPMFAFTSCRKFGIAAADLDPTLGYPIRAFN